MARTGGSNDLIAIRPVHAAGVNTAVDAETVMSGTFLVASTAGGNTSLVNIRFSTTGLAAGTVPARLVNFNITDGDSGTSNTVSRTVNVN